MFCFPSLIRKPRLTTVRGIGVGSIIYKLPLYGLVQPWLTLAGQAPPFAQLSHRDHT